MYNVNDKRIMPIDLLKLTKKKNILNKKKFKWMISIYFLTKKVSIYFQ